jgi:hypothetical protein
MPYAEPGGLVEELQPRTCEQLYRALVKTCAVDTHRNALAVAKAFGAWCVKQGWVATSPLAEVAGVGQLGYLYRSPAVVSEDESDRVHEDPHASFGRPGSRAPHLWLDRDGRPISTIDLFGRAFVVIAAPDGAGWAEAARSVARTIEGLELEVHVVGRDGLSDREGRFASAHGLTSSGQPSCARMASSPGARPACPTIRCARSRVR